MLKIQQDSFLIVADSFTIETFIENDSKYDVLNLDKNPQAPIQQINTCDTSVSFCFDHIANSETLFRAYHAARSLKKEIEAWQKSWEVIHEGESTQTLADSCPWSSNFSSH